MDDHTSEPRVPQDESATHVSDDTKRRVELILEHARVISSRPVLDARTPDEILGYDEFGIPR